jgi:hypothetical protein
MSVKRGKLDTWSDPDASKPEGNKPTKLTSICTAIFFKFKFTSETCHNIASQYAATHAKINHMIGNIK